MHPRPLRHPIAARLSIVLALVTVVGSALADTALSPASNALTGTVAPRYLSLGDSLAAGLQPDSKGVDHPTRDGYADVLGRRLIGAYPRLRTNRLSCGGATTWTLLNGGASCQARDEPGQVVQAERFLEAHPETVLVTVNIGDNDVEGCLKTRPPSIDDACVSRGRAVIRRNLPAIASRLRSAAGPRARVIGILDYDQFLGLWLTGPAGRDVARRSAGVILSLNRLMAGIYRHAGVEIADAGLRFATADLQSPGSLPGVGAVPLAVERICRWTWACAAPPVGPDDHARAQGYRVIAESVLDTLAHDDGGVAAG